MEVRVILIFLGDAIRKHYTLNKKTEHEVNQALNQLRMEEPENEFEKLVKNFLLVAYDPHQIELRNDLRSNLIF